MTKLQSTNGFARVIRTFFVWVIFLSFSGIIFTANIVQTPEGLALAPSQVYADSVCDASFGDVGGQVGCLLKVVLFSPAQLFSIGIGFAVTLIEYATNPSVFNKLFDLPAVYTAWGVVRDIFNVIFIFVLLFSAFATIFQVQKYHLKNILLMVVIMALLVNFSWPLTGLIIDFSNVLMLFFLGDQSGIGLASEIGKSSSFAEALLGGGGNPRNSDVTTLIMIDIFVFIFMITMFAVAFQLFIRTIALLVLLIFSPIGIAGTAIPKMQGLSKMWWENFTRYSFTGPIAVFMLVFSAALMQDFTASDIEFDLRQNSADTAVPYGADLMTNIQKFIIPMIILWIGVAATSKLSDVGSKFVTSRAKGLASRAGKGFAKGARSTAVGSAMLGYRGAKGGARAIDNATGNNAASLAGKFRGLKTRRDNMTQRSQGAFKDASDRSQAKFVRSNNKVGQYFGGDPNAITKDDRVVTGKIAKEIGESGIGAKEAAQEFANAQGLRKAALGKFMTSKDAISSDDDLKIVLNAFAKDIKNNESDPNNDLVKAAKKNAMKAIQTIGDDVTDDFKYDQYKDARDKLDQTPIGTEIREKLDQKLTAKRRFDITTEYEIKNNGDPSKIINQLNLTQVSDSTRLAKVLRDNAESNPISVTRAARAVQDKINSPRALEQYNIRASEQTKNDYGHAGVIADH